MDSFIFSKEKALDADTCETLIDGFKKHIWFQEPGQSGYGISEHKVSTDITLHGFQQSSEHKNPENVVVPLARAAIIMARCEIDLSPGIDSIIIVK